MAAVRTSLLKSEHFSAKKVRELVTEFTSEAFWREPDERYSAPIVSPPERGKLKKVMDAIYDTRSKYVHAGQPFPRHVEVGLTSRVDMVAAMDALALSLAKKRPSLPTFPWFERLTADVIRNCLRRWFAPELEEARARSMLRKNELREQVRGLPEKANRSLRKLVDLTVPFLGMAVVNPYLKNGRWSADVETTELLARKGLIGGTGSGMEDDSWLLDREVGEAVGAEFFGEGANPFLRQQLLLPPKKLA